jgi:hypothetical protein
MEFFKNPKILLTLAIVLLAVAAGYCAHAKGYFAPKQIAAVPSTVVFSCDGPLASQFGCYEKFYTNIVLTEGVAAAFADLKDRYNTNGYVKAQCHPIAHAIGRAAVQKYPDVSSAYEHGDSYCWSGYYHGVLEAVVANIGRENVPDELNTICANIPGKDRYSFDYFNCVHGLGHGLMAFTNDELPDSLKLCDRLSGNWENRSCYGGVFMENIIANGINHVTKYLKADDPLYPCDGIDDKYRTDCYLMQTSHMLAAENNDFKKVFDLCSSVGTFADTCYQSLGRDASGQNSSDPVITKTRCMLGADFDQRSNCVIGAVKDFISYFHGIDQGNVFCNSLDADLAKLCLDVGSNYYKNL